MPTPKFFHTTAIAVAAIFIATATTTSTAGELLGYYEFEDNYNDSSGKGNAAEESQNPDQLSFAAGFRGQALDINDPDADPNSGGSVDLPIDANPDTHVGVTFGGWLKVAPENFEFDGFMAIDNGGWDRGISVNYNSSGLFGVASGAGPTQVGEITAGDWQYVVGTFDGDDNKSTLYVGDADADTQTTQAASGIDAMDLGEPVIELGRYDNQDLDALVDDIFVFDGALSAHEVNAIRNLRLRGSINYSPLQVSQLFVLFEDREAGEIGGLNWTPTTGLDTEEPGALFDFGEAGIAVVLDDAGNGMIGSGEAIVPMDTDGDGMDDLWETVNFGGLERDGTGDFDEDAFTDLEEFQAGTNPKNRDTDGDGLVDGDETKTHGTDPLKADTDGDTWSDGAELAYDPPSDPTDPASFPKLPTVPLLAYYEFEDNFDDSSGLGNNAVPTQNPDEISFVPGFRGKSADINDPDAGANTGGSINIPIDANPTELPEVSFGGWINVAPNNAEFDGFMAIDNGGWDRGISVNYNNSGLFGIASGAGPGEIGEITRGDWQYVVATFSNDEGRAILYVGDASSGGQTTEAVEAQDLGQPPGEVEIEIGRYDNQDLDGIVDDIFVFGGELSPHQVNAIRNLRLSNANYSPAQASRLFQFFEDGQSGQIDGATWTPTTGLPTAEPGALIDKGEAGVAVVLDDAGNGMLGDADAFLVADSDGDGLDDLWEMVNFGNLGQTAEGDADGDGLKNLDEFTIGTKPNNKDSDGDGLEDGAEVATHMTDPLNSDTDGDTWSDGAELAFDPPTDPKNPADFPRLPALPLLGYYQFEDNFDDSSGLGNDAAPAQNPDEVTFIEGFRGKSADINDPDAGANTGGSINIPIDANRTELPEVSFGGWINVDPDNTEFDGFMAIDNGGWDRGISVNYNSSGLFGIASGAGPGELGEITGGDWQYVIATFNDEEDRAVLYVGSADQADQTTETIEVPDAGDTPGETEIEIGRYDNQDLDGIVDDIFVFGGELDRHQANAVRNLRLSGLDYSPREAAQLFDFFAEQESGAIGGVNWTQAAGLDADPPGAVVEAGGSVSVVLDDAGNGMMTGNARLFEITSIVLTTDGATRTVTLTWNSRSGRNYALDTAPALSEWLEVDDGIESGGSETTFTDTSPAVSTDEVRYYRVREVQ